MTDVKHKCRLFYILCLIFVSTSTTFNMLRTALNVITNTSICNNPLKTNRNSVSITAVHTLVPTTTNIHFILTMNHGQTITNLGSVDACTNGDFLNFVAESMGIVLTDTTIDCKRGYIPYQTLHISKHFEFANTRTEHITGFHLQYFVNKHATHITVSNPDILYMYSSGLFIDDTKCTKSALFTNLSFTNTIIALELEK